MGDADGVIHLGRLLSWRDRGGAGRAGHFAGWESYALAVTMRLGLEDRGGMVRIGAVHYNTIEEIRWSGEALRTMASRERDG